MLGVDVPDPPDVSLAGIRADAATLNWTRAPANWSVQRFLIQVNGVVGKPGPPFWDSHASASQLALLSNANRVCTLVGDVPANQEPAIVVTGLKPNHYYNVRVIAVGSNNFQAGSRVVRLRTFTSDGRPQLGNSRLPSNFLLEEGASAGQGDSIDDNGGPRASVPGLETATNPETVASPARDLNPPPPQVPVEIP